MAKAKKGSARLNTAAEIGGRSLGRVAGKIDSLKARHPHPVKEVEEVRRKAVSTASRATEKAVKGAKQAAERARKTVSSRVKRFKR